MSKLSDLLKKAEQSMEPKKVAKAVQKAATRHLAKERRDAAFAATPEARMARSITAIQEQRRQEAKERREKEERELAEFKEFREERAEYLALQRRWQLGGMTQQQFDRLQELKTRHAGAENQ